MLDPAQVEELFVKALDAPPHKRAEWLATACGSDVELRARVEQLLAAHGNDSNFLPLPTTSTDAAIESAGLKIGRYQLLEQIGEGGFGVVFMAEQTSPVRRRVALKIIKLGMDTRQVVARFEAERQALAMMDHENIARVFDAGATETGRPYFVMELVRGVPLTSYCDDNKLTTRERLKLFMTVCSAVQHAHQKGIIHRDLKPNNVLVTMHDDRPVPKVIDFGVAKATQSRLTDHTLFTEFRQMIGTPAYMSPEQAQMSGLDIDTRSDVYSLGVLLYELLTGTTPFDTKELHAASFDQMRQLICDTEPPRPSTRLATLTADRQVTAAGARGVDVRKLTQGVRGDLDWIVMKCLEKDRKRRYETVNALCRDVERYLADEPVHARPPTRAYRMRKFVRRNKLAVLASAAVVLGLVAGIIGTTVGLASESRRRLAAEREQTTTEFSLANALVGGFRYPDAEALLRKVLARRVASKLPEDQRDAAITCLHLSRVVLVQGRVNEAEKLAREALVAHRRAFPPGDANIVEALRYHARLLRDYRRDFVQAEQLFRESLAINLASATADHLSTGNDYLYVAVVLFEQRKLAEAEAAYRSALSEYARIPDQAGYSVEANMGLGRTLAMMNRFAEAETALMQYEPKVGGMLEQLQYAGLIAAVYYAWEQQEPGKGHELKARAWMTRLTESWLRSHEPSTQPVHFRAKAAVPQTQPATAPASQP